MHPMGKWLMADQTTVNSPGGSALPPSQQLRRRRRRRRRILVIIIDSKALFEIFHILLTAPRTVSNTYAQVARAQSCANHVQHIERLSHASVVLRATWYEGTAQLLSLTELKSHLCELYFIG